MTILLMFFPVLIGATDILHESVWKKNGGFFPNMYFTDVLQATKRAEDAYPYWV